MKFLFTSDLTGMGGGETGLVYLIGELCRSHACMAICGSDGPLVERLRLVGADVAVIDYKNKARLPRNLLGLRSAIMHFSPDYIFNNDPMTACLVHAAAPSFDNNWICHGQWYKFDRFREFLLKRSVRRVLCVSNAARNNLFNQGFDNCSTVYLGVPTTLFANAKAANIRKSLGISSSGLLVATVARFQPIKGQLKGVKAVELALKQGLDVTYLLIGGSVFGSASDDNYEQVVKDYVRDNGLDSNVLFLGERQDVPSILKDVDILIVPSDNESFGVAAVEAICSGAALLSTPNDGVSEIVEGNSTYLSCTNSAEGLAALLVKYKDRNFLNASKAGLEPYRRKFDIATVADSYIRAVTEGNK